MKKKVPFFKIITTLAAFLTIGLLVLLLFYILINGIPHLSSDLFQREYTTENVSAFPAIINTLIITLVSLIISVPLGIFTAFYLVEYAKSDNKIIGLIRLATETLAGIPSIVYGLFGRLFFVVALGWGFSLLAGSFTLSIMILPLIIRTTEESLIAIDDSLREASFALGAGKLRTIFKVVVPSAVPAIVSGVILAIGRIVGETAALMYTAGTVAEIPNSLMGSGRTLALHMYALSSEGFYVNQANATAVILIVIVFVINEISSYVGNKFKGV